MTVDLDILPGSSLRGRAVETDDHDRFMRAYGDLFEYSPWVVERAWTLRPFADAAALHAALLWAIHAATDEERISLILAHPELANKAAIVRGLTANSTAEQATAGLDQLSPAEYDDFHALNLAYRQRFGFPFIICVRLHNKVSILAQMRQRMMRDKAAETREAIAQIGLISKFRLADAVVAGPARESAAGKPNATRGLAELSKSVRRDLDILGVPGREWVRKRAHPKGAPVYDVVIIGGGQSGLGAAFGLLREGVRNIVVLDENDAGMEGPWATYARMATLRTPKHLTGIDFGIPSLTFRAWWEAQYGVGGWLSLDKISKEDWMRYLRWYRDALGLPVQNRTRVTRVEPLVSGIYRLTVAGRGAPSPGVLLARKVIFATGIQGGGEWHVPGFIRDHLPRTLYAHTSEEIDFKALKGKRIGILGGGASAFDNAQFALRNDVAEVHVFVRRSELPRINPIRHMEQSGLLRHFDVLSDAHKYAAVSHFLFHNQPPTNDTFNRAASYAGFRLHLGAGWESVREVTDGVEVTTPKGTFAFDRLIVSTGLRTDVSLRPELATVASDIALWRDRYTPPAELSNSLIDDHPYLGPSFEFIARTEEGRSRLYGLFAFNYSALASHGLSASSLSGLKMALPRLVGGVTAQLFLDDQDSYLKAFVDYAEPEFVGQWAES